MGASMRLGAYPSKITKGTKSFAAYKNENISERHRHRYEFNNKYKKIFEKEGMVFSGVTTKDNLVEIIELKDHLWFVACQFHPEFKSKPDHAHPLFNHFVKASLETHIEDKSAGHPIEALDEEAHKLDATHSFS